LFCPLGVSFVRVRRILGLDLALLGVVGVSAGMRKFAALPVGLGLNRLFLSTVVPLLGLIDVEICVSAAFLLSDTEWDLDRRISSLLRHGDS